MTTTVSRGGGTGPHLLSPYAAAVAGVRSTPGWVVGVVDPDLMVAGVGGDGDAELVAGGVSGGFPGVMVLVKFVPESP
jgi:hypothetical protein